MPKYIDKKHLQTLVKQAKKDKCLSPELSEVVSKIMRGLLDRHRWKLWHSSKEDCCQDAVMLISRKIQNMDHKANVFAYITTCCFNLLRQTYRAEMLAFKTLDGLKKSMKKSRRDKLRDRWIDNWDDPATHG